MGLYYTVLPGFEPTNRIPKQQPVKGFFRGGFGFGRMLAFGKRLVP